MALRYSADIPTVNGSTSAPTVLRGAQCFSGEIRALHRSIDTDEEADINIPMNEESLTRLECRIKGIPSPIGRMH
jgi:hypothetical protein